MDGPFGACGRVGIVGIAGGFAIAFVRAVAGCTQCRVTCTNTFVVAQR